MCRSPARGSAVGRAAVRRSATRRLALAAGVAGALALGGCANSGVTLGDVADIALGESAGSGPLSTSEIVQGLKAALEKGSGEVVGRLGRPNGFLNDPIASIPLPESLQSAADFASKVGLGGYFDDLRAKLNRAAEEATPEARALFVGAIRQMGIDDARRILSGPDDAATQYFERTTGDQLVARMRPIVDRSLAQVGAVQAFDELLSRYRRIPLAPPIEADLTGYVAGEAKRGIFHYLAEEERAIRENPVERTSAILKRVFGAAGAS